MMVFLLAFGHFLMGQSLPDFSTIKVDELSDSQIEVILKRAREMGVSQGELLKLAGEQGLSASQISLLGQRLTKVSSDRVSLASSDPEASREREETLNEVGDRAVAPVSRIFGMDIFNGANEDLTFAPTQNIATPANYLLGAGDEVFVDIFGESEQYYQATINPDGNIVLENVGPLFLSGLTVSQAEKRLKQKLSSLYTGLNNGKVGLSVTLGEVRSIQVSLVGQLKRPGTYTLSGLSTAFNALFQAGGVSEDGTLRAIKVFRNSQLVATIDVYDFLLNGNSQSNLMLRNNDVILVSPYENRVTLEGAVKTPAIFETLPGETFSDLLLYAGGMRDDAYTEKVALTRNQDGQKAVADLYQDQFGIFTLQGGDRFLVDPILNRFANRVIVKGAVLRPGNYAIGTGLTVKQLIEKAQGLRPDAFGNRAFIVRNTEDLNTRTISFSLSDLIAGRSEDLVLQREDVLTILSGNDLRGERYVQITGEVKNPGIFPFSEQMQLEDLVLLAGGLKESATGLRAEITRRISNDSDNNFDLSNVILVELDRELRNSAPNSGLAPFDHVIIRRNPNFHIERLVSVVAESL